jgi:hypothetical protein
VQRIKLNEKARAIHAQDVNLAMEKLRVDRDGLRMQVKAWQQAKKDYLIGKATPEALEKDRLDTLKVQYATQLLNREMNRLVQNVIYCSFGRLMAADREACDKALAIEDWGQYDRLSKVKESINSRCRSLEDSLKLSQPWSFKGSEHRAACRTLENRQFDQAGLTLQRKVIALILEQARRGVRGTGKGYLLDCSTAQLTLLSRCFDTAEYTSCGPEEEQDSGRST